MGSVAVGANETILLSRSIKKKFNRAYFKQGRRCDRMSLSGTSLRLQCDFRVAHPTQPWNRSENGVKIGTGFLVRLNGTPVILTARAFGTKRVYAG